MPIIGMASSGAHSNGYSLIRKLVTLAGANEKTQLDGKSLYDRLLAPTRIYVKSCLELAKKIPVKGFAHITGGGITDNIPRVLPDGLEVHLQRSSLASRPGVRLAAHDGARRQRGDVSHLQLRHRHDRRRSGGTGGRGHPAAARSRRDREPHR